MITNADDEKNVLPLFIAVIFFIFVLAWLILGELKNKFIIVRLAENKISIAKLGGVLPIIDFNSSEIEGWKYSILPSKTRDYEYLYLYAHGKKIAKISQFYHKNYPDIKKYVSDHYANLGFEEFSYLKEFKEIFE